MNKLNKYYPYLLIGIISFILNLFLHSFGVYNFIESKFYNFKFNLRGPINEITEKENDVVIVEIDDESYRLINESYPYPRGTVYSKIIENLTKAQAKVIVFDIMFDSEDHTAKILEHHLNNNKCYECSYIDQDEQFYNAIKYEVDALYSGRNELDDVKGVLNKTLKICNLSYASKSPIDLDIKNV